MPPNVRVVGPSNGRPPSTTVVLLHGYGADAASIEPLARAFSRSLPSIAVIVPDGCEPWEGGGAGRQWFSLDGATDQNRLPRLRGAAGPIAAWLDVELPKRALPTSRIVYVGFSQGATLSIYLGLHRTPKPLAIVSLSGRFIDDVASGPPSDVPVLITHGVRDPMIPFAESDVAYRELKTRGAKVERITRPAMGHEVDDVVLDGAIEFLARILGPQ